MITFSMFISKRKKKTIIFYAFYFLFLSFSQRQ